MTCNFSGLSIFICNFANAYTMVSASATGKLVAGILSIVVGVFGIVRTVYAVKNYRFRKLLKKLENLRESGSLIKSFQDSDFEYALKDYIEPYCSNIDPAGLDDLRNTVSVRQKVLETMGAELSMAGKRFILVLADSGMGKTTLLLNMVALELKKKEGDRRRMALVPLGQPGALRQINEIKDQRNTVLLLDAYDEDSRAISHAELRMGELVKAAANYSSVVMTCRTQFFESDYALPGNTGLKRVAGRKAGEPTIYTWRTVYLQPFDANQIEALIRKSIPVYQPRQRAKARLIASKIHDLAARPMLTALIPELSRSSSNANGLWDLYVFMVDSWLTREQDWIEPTQLLQLSKKLAVSLITNRERRGGERISVTELIQDLDLPKQAVMSWNMTGRSLLNRDAVGSIKFAHRSILEFLFVWAFVDGEETCSEVVWTDLMKQFLISWGFSSSHDYARAQKIFAMDLRKTELFPYVDRVTKEPLADKATTKVHESALSSSIGSSEAWPNSWWVLTSQVIERDGVVRVYDFVRGVVWQVIATKSIPDRGERDVHRESFVQTGQNIKSGMRWDVTDLHYFLCFLSILNRLDKLFSVIDSRELYWISSLGTGMQARIRSESDALIAYPNLSLMTTLSLEFAVGGSDGANKVSIDLYRPPSGIPGSRPLALRISIGFADAEKIWHDDKDSKTDWSIETAMNSGFTPKPRPK